MYYCKCKLPAGENQTICTMQFSEISKGRLEDVEKTLEMFVSITDALLAHDIDQWNYDYPDIQTLKDDVVNGENYVVRAPNMVLASIVLNDAQDEQYKNIRWKYNHDAVLVIHRLGVHPQSQGKGLGKKMCLFAEHFAKEHNFKSIRLDAYSGNEISNRLYQSLGYIQADGLCYFRNKDIPFNCYEKEII